MAKSRAKTALLFGVPAILLALVLLVTGAGSHRDPARAERDIVRAATRHCERFPELIELIQEHVDRKAIAGAVVLVLHRGKPVCFEALGNADAEARTPMARDTIFRIASMTKPITTVAALMLVEDGKLRLDDPVSKYLPEFKDMTVLVPTTGDIDKPYRLVKADRAVTIQHLLTHTSGITYRLSNRPHLGLLYADAGISDGLVETAGRVGDNVSRLAKLPLLHQPGAAWEYGLSTDVLGRVVEIASGKTLDEFFRARIFEPLRMQDTGFVVPKDKRSRLAALYTPDDKKRIHRVGESPVTFGSATFSATYSTADDSRYQSGGSGLASTAGDYGRFLQMLLNRGEFDSQRLLKAETVDRMTRNQIGALKSAFPIHGDGFGYGLGVVTGREEPASPASKGSYSWGGIFNTFFWVDPNEELIGLMLTQLYPFDHLALRQDFQELVYQEITKETKVSVDEPPGASKSDRHVPPRVRVSEVTIHGDMDCFQVETPSATYVYGKKGAGFASILDKDGRDWISYRPGGKAKGEYRGLPKCGQPTKFFHCGYGYGQYKTDNVFVSKVTVREADHVRIAFETRDKKSAGAWDFYPRHATLTLLRIDAPTFWFLYEGTPGGRLDPDKDFVIRPDGRKSSLNEPWSQVVPWVCFGAGETPVGFVCVNHQGPEKGQTDSYVSWPFQKDKDGSFQDMTVFGFGRKGHKELVEHVPDLTGLPARYSIALVERADYATAKASYEKLRQLPKEEARDDGFLTLFDGKTLDGWEGKEEYFSVKDGAIHAETTKDKPLKSNTFLVYTRRQFADFELRFDYKVVGGNSGMQYRSERLPDFGMKGYQADFENQNRFTGMFFEENGRLFLAYPGEFVTIKPLTDAARTKTPNAKAVLDKVPFATRAEVFSHIKDATAWHSMTVLARGNMFVHVLDGRVMSVAVDDDPKNFRKSGYLGLQVHSGPPMTIDLKNIRVRELK